MNKRPRVSHQQRELLLEYMMGHADLARGRVAGADASRRKDALLKELACQLNALGTGATKTPEKWWKCWQDWRSDTKSKALRLKKHSGGTGGGPNSTPLTKLEETLLQFCGVEMVVGIVGVLDPLEHTEQLEEVQETQNITNVSEPSSSKDVPAVEEARPSRKNSLEKSLERQAAALEKLALGMEAIGDSIQAVATAMHSGFMALATAIENKPQEFLFSVSEQNN